MVEHVHVTFGDPSRIGFWNIVRKNRQKDRQTRVKTVPHHCRWCGYWTTFDLPSRHCVQSFCTVV